MQSTRITYTSATVPSLSRRLASTAVPPPPPTVPPAIHAGPNRGEGDAVHRYDPHADHEHLLSIAAAVRGHQVPQHPDREQSSQVSELERI